MKTKLLFELSLPIIIAALLVFFNFVGFYKNIESAIYDQLLHIKRPVQEHGSILLLDIDDTAINKVGTFPWSRDIMADGLIVMKEFNAAYAVFDIEYVNKSPRGLNAEFLENDIPNTFAQEFASIDQNMRDLLGAIEAGYIQSSEVGPFVDDLSLLNQTAQDNLLNKLDEIARDNDEYLGQAARFFDNSFFTVTMQTIEEPDLPDELRKWALENLPIPQNKLSVQDYNHEAIDILPAILPVISSAKGAGFPNVPIDEDGVQRRISLIFKNKDEHFGQLSFRPLLKWLGMPEIEISGSKIILKDAEHPDFDDPINITIPLTTNQEMLINWPAKKFLDSFRHLTYWEIVRYNRLESALLNNLTEMKNINLTAYGSDPHFLSAYYEGEKIKNFVLSGGDLINISEYREVREYFFSRTGDFLSTETEQIIIAELDSLISSIPEPELKTTYINFKVQVQYLFEQTREVYDNIVQSRETLSEALEDSFVIIGHTATSTTDLGQNPFEQAYMNVGTHASVANTILQQDFLDDTPWWTAIIVGFSMSIAVIFSIRNLSPVKAVIIGPLFIFLVGFSGVFFFLLTQTYINLATPVLATFLTVFGISLYKFVITGKEKNFLKSAFSQYLSPDVISDLIDDPSKLSLGGEEKHLTAMFTDVKGFSTVSEKLTPTQLVSLLNEYLSAMSNIVLSQRGTIDKFEGDAIISFFGAPVDFEDHAARTCHAAIEMHLLEDELNKHFIEKNMTPTPLRTRFGINTGPMVVGNMGTEGKMDYTMMGSAVNLAARLEGVNKKFGTWILISEQTKKAADKHDEIFTVRKLDRVRVVGINEPVRLFELINLKAKTPQNQAEGIHLFHEALDMFEDKNWKESLKYFEKAIESIPNDPPSKLYLKRCTDLIEGSALSDMDDEGVFNLTEK